MTSLRLDNISQVLNDSMMNAVQGHNASFSKTHFEIKNGVERPRLNETNMDPDMLKEFGYGSPKND